MLSELAAGVGYLTGQATIQPGKIGVLGFSMGSTHAYWLAALDERVACAVALCSFADLSTLVASGAHDGHGIYMTVPGLLSGWSTGTVAGLAAPRPLFVGVGLQDWSTPDDAFSIARDELQAAYDVADAQRALTFHVERDLDHRESEAMRTAVLDFLERELGANRDTEPALPQAGAA